MQHCIEVKCDVNLLSKMGGCNSVDKKCCCQYFFDFELISNTPRPRVKALRCVFVCVHVCMRVCVLVCVCVCAYMRRHV